VSLILAQHERFQNILICLLLNAAVKVE